MFKVATDPTFTHQVVVMIPIDGGFDKQSFKATFRVLGKEEDRPDLSTADGSTAFLRDVVTDMSELEGEDGQPLPYSDALRDRLLKVPYVQAALVRTYVAAVSKAPAGN